MLQRRLSIILARAALGLGLLSGCGPDPQPEQATQTRYLLHDDICKSLDYGSFDALFGSPNRDLVGNTDSVTASRALCTVITTPSSNSYLSTASIKVDAAVYESSIEAKQVYARSTRDDSNLENSKLTSSVDDARYYRSGDSYSILVLDGNLYLKIVVYSQISKSSQSEAAIPPLIGGFGDQVIAKLRG